MTAYLEHTTDSIFAKNLVLEKQLAESLAKNDSFEKKIQYLEEQLAWFKNQLFGKRSERIVTADASQLYLDGLSPPSSNASAEEAPAQPTQPPIPKTRRKRVATGADAVSFSDDVPTERIYLDVKEEDKTCPLTNKPLVQIGEEVTSKLAHKPGSFYVKQYVRPKYAYPKEADQGILVAELPDSLLPKCQVDESFLAELCVRKYSDHLPCYRLCEIFARDGLGISRQQLSKWIIGVGTALSPLYDLMHKKCKEGDISYLDESPVDLLGKKKGKAHQAYMWLWVGGLGNGPQYSVYHFRTSRQHKHAAELLAGYLGYVHSDKYEAYEILASQKKFTWCPCWAHVRRYFFEAEGGKEMRDWFLRKIRYLFMLERVAWARSPEERLRIRQEKEAPIIDEMIAVAEKRIGSGKDLPKSKMRKALGYFIGLKPYLKNYTEHPYARLDNNPAERAVRPLAIGRKNWLFLGSEEGGKAAAVILSLIQTCRSMKINPREYLEDVMRRFNGHPYNRLEELLPDQWAKQRNAMSAQ